MPIKILCSVYKLVNHEKNPENLNELISSRQTTYALRGKDIQFKLAKPQHNTLYRNQSLALSGTPALETLA